MVDFENALDPGEHKRMVRFKDVHNKCKWKGALPTCGGRFKIIVFPTSIGTFATIKCVICKKDAEISDSDSF
jgi:hypothetical protein